MLNYGVARVRGKHASLRIEGMTKESARIAARELRVAGGTGFVPVIVIRSGSKLRMLGVSPEKSPKRASGNVR